MEKTGFLLFRKKEMVSDLINQANENKIEISVQPFNKQENFSLKKQKQSPVTFYSTGIEFLLAGLLLVAFYFLEDDD